MPELTICAQVDNLMLRLLTSLPPAKVRFTIIDPVGLGQNFSAFMHLADFDIGKFVSYGTKFYDKRVPGKYRPTTRGKKMPQ